LEIYQKEYTYDARTAARQNLIVVFARKRDDNR